MKFKKGNNLATGGARKGSGRKPSAVKAIAAIFSSDPEAALDDLTEIRRIAYDPATSEKVRVQALIYLVDRRLGKPKEPREHSGGITIQIEGYSPDLAE
jgi:hypothetical protein